MIDNFTHGLAVGGSFIVSNKVSRMMTVLVRSVDNLVIIYYLCDLCSENCYNKSVNILTQYAQHVFWSHLQQVDSTSKDWKAELFKSFGSKKTKRIANIG